MRTKLHHYGRRPPITRIEEVKQKRPDGIVRQQLPLESGCFIQVCCISEG
jgi:hypothetical protein